MIVAAVVGLVSAPLLPLAPAAAVTVAPLTQIYDQVVNGDYIMVGNGSLVCDPNKATLQGSFTCAQLHNGTSATGYVNDFKFMGYVDVDANAATVNSSSATVTIPTGAKVVKAVLYWSGNTGQVRSGTSFLTNRCSTNTVPSPYITPSGSPSTQSVVLSSSLGTASVAPTTYNSESFAQLADLQAQYYAAKADVTSQLSALTGTQTITVGNLWAVQGYGCYAGWSLALVYDFGTFDPANAALTGAREVILYDGYVRKQAADPTPEVVPFTNFLVQGTGSRVGFTLYEGDRNITGDFATYQSNLATSPTEIQNALGGLNNIGVSIADGSVPYVTGASPFVNANVDVRNQNIPQLGVGSTSMNLSLDTAGDSFLLQNAILSVPVASVKIYKTYNGTLDEQTVAAGGTPTYTISVVNSGSVALTGLTVTDALAPGCARTIASLPVAPTTGSTFTYTCTGPATSTPLVNSATVAGKSALGADLTSTDTTVVHVPLLSVTKSASPTIVAPGGTTTWTITVTNTGDVPLSTVSTTDALAASCSKASLGSLAVGASTTYTCTSTNITAGFTNSVTAQGTSGGVTATATATAPVQVRSLSITKTASPTTITAAGQSITYSFVVTNTGSAPLTSISVTDIPSAPAGPAPVVTCPTTTLAVGASTTCTATYAATQADVDNGSIVNTASVSGTDSGGGTASATSAPATVAVTQSPAVTVTKSASPATITAAGQSVTYSFVVTNTGNVTLKNLAVADTMTAPAGPAPTISCPRTTLAPTATMTCTATYVATQADVDAGSIRNTATVSGSTQLGTAVTSSPSSATVTATPAPALTLTKSVASIQDTNNDGLNDAGDKITYSFVVTNSGNTTLSNVTLTDPLLSGGNVTISCPSSTLAPGASMTCTVSGPYSITSTQQTGGSVTNTATVTGTTPTGTTTTATSTAVVPTATPQGNMSLTKTAAPTSVTAVGETVTYTFRVTNTGNVRLTGLTINDTFTTGGTGATSAITCAATTLAVGASTTCTGTYLTTQADLDAGKIVNSAYSTAAMPSGTQCREGDLRPR